MTNVLLENGYIQETTNLKIVLFLQSLTVIEQFTEISITENYDFELKAIFQLA